MIKHTRRTALVTLSGLGLSSIVAPEALSQAAGGTGTPLSPSRLDMPTTMLSFEQMQSDLALMRRALQVIHPGLTRYTRVTVFNQACDRLAQFQRNGRPTTEFYMHLASVLGLIRCSHTKAEQPPAIAAWRETNPTHLPFRFALIEGRMIVTATDGRGNGPPRSAEILSINGASIGNIIRRVSPYVAVDGYTDGSRQTLLARDSDLMGSDLDHYMPYIFGFADRFDLRWRAAENQNPRDGAVRSGVRSALSFEAWRGLEGDGWSYRQNFGTSTTWRMASPGVGLLKIDTFVNYRQPVDAAALYSQAISELNDQGMTRLVVDLRDNGGGSDDAALGLIDALAIGPYTYQSAVRMKRPRYDDLPNFIETWGDRGAIFNPPLDRFTERSDGWFDLKPEFSPGLLQPRQPAQGAFTGPVTLLVGPKNASAATMVIAKLKDMGRVRLVGSDTGGSAQGPTAGRVFMLKLPESQIVVRIPQIWNVMTVAGPFNGQGVSPDVPVRDTVADFLEGRDRALESAVAG